MCKQLSQSGVVFEKTDHDRGVIKEQNVSGDVFEQNFCKGDVISKNKQGSYGTSTIGEVTVFGKA